MRRSPVTIAPDAKLDEARDLMARHRIRHLPVVEQGKLVGMLSSGDLGAHVGQLARTKVNAAMTTEATTVAPSVGAATAARLMLERKVRALPVVDGEQVIGVISTSDVLEEYARAARH
jgi:CBS domain-containing protein